MKNLFLFVVAASFVMISCTNPPKGDKAEVSKAKVVEKEELTTTNDTYTLKLESSSIAWIGTKPAGQHNGSVSFKSGEFKFSAGKLTGGKFVTDMPTIEVLDLKKGEEMHTKLVNHLRSADFFDIDSFPTGAFEITSAEEIANPVEKEGLKLTHKITGNLTLKNITKSITFDAQVDVKDNMVTAKTGNIVVDRTEWGIKYKSKKFSSELKDKFINDEFSFSITLEATKNKPNGAI